MMRHNKIRAGGLLLQVSSGASSELSDTQTTTSDLLIRRPLKLRGSPDSIGRSEPARLRLKAGSVDTNRTLNGLHPSDVIADRFRIIRFIDRGGMGEVYEAEDLAMRSRHRLALKIIRRKISTNGAVVARFEREIEIGKEVTHRNVCRIYDLGVHHAKDPSGRPVDIVFLTMELLQGSTLALRLSRQGPLSTLEALPLIRQIAEALTAVHAAGVVHCDLKPGNIMLVPVENQECPRAVVTDFGLARRFPDLAPNGEFTTYLVSADGTPDYMSPEQVMGLPLTPKSDIYALGLLTYQMLTGALPFPGSDPHSRMRRRLQQDPTSPLHYIKGLDHEWERVLLRCLSIDPEVRFNSARDVVSALTSINATPPDASPDGRAGPYPQNFANRIA